MGGLLSRLRAKPSTKELLEEVDKEIQTLEDYKRSTEAQHKRIVGSLIFYFILLFIVSAGIFLVYYIPHLPTTKEKLIYSTPLWCVPVLCFIVKKFLHWYFNQKIKCNEENLVQLKRRRRSLIELAMETETYKVVKDLLEKYDPEYHKRIFETRAITASASVPSSFQSSFGEMEVRKRVVPSKSPSVPNVAPGQTITMTTGTGPPPALFSPIIVRTPVNPPIHTLPPRYIPRNNPPLVVRPPVPQMARPVLPRERSLMDRLVDYMVGDGPSNRYALICRQCSSHNGMALRDDFENIAFRCCYCYHWNPPKNQQTLQPGEQKSPQLALPASPSSPVVTEPNSTGVSRSSSNSSLADDSSRNEEPSGETFSFSGRRSPKSGSSSPSTPRKRIRDISSENEIQAVLEEDKLNHLHADLD